MVIEELFGNFQYCPNFVHCLFKPLTRFYSTVSIESDDHKLIAMTKQTTKLAGNFLFRFSKLLLFFNAWSIASGAIAVLIAFSK